MDSLHVYNWFGYMYGAKFSEMLVNIHRHILEKKKKKKKEFTINTIGEAWLW